MACSNENILLKYGKYVRACTSKVPIAGGVMDCDKSLGMQIYKVMTHSFDETHKLYKNILLNDPIAVRLPCIWNMATFLAMDRERLDNYYTYFEDVDLPPPKFEYNTLDLTVHQNKNAEITSWSGSAHIHTSERDLLVKIVDYLCEIKKLTLFYSQSTLNDVIYPRLEFLKMDRELAKFWRHDGVLRVSHELIPVESIPPSAEVMCREYGLSLTLASGYASGPTRLFGFKIFSMFWDLGCVLMKNTAIGGDDDYTFPGGFNYCDGRQYLENGVTESDFVSFYPTISDIYNLSFETVGIFRVKDIRIGNATEDDFTFLKYTDHKQGMDREYINGTIECNFAPVSLVQCRENDTVLVITTRQRQRGVLSRVFEELNIHRKTNANLKRLSSCMYGLLGCKNGPFYAPHVAAAITFFGRQLVIQAAHATMDITGYNCVYIDTDSVFIDSPVLTQALSALEMTSTHYKNMVIISKKCYIATVASTGVIKHRGVTRSAELSKLVEWFYLKCISDKKSSFSGLIVQLPPLKNEDYTPIAHILKACCEITRD
ncbi:MAG: hypothetical protein MUO31_07140 [Thermodesulfovibrionales bacterium]|nr:hypothetical protein [Thermodesulfovibrionales bacterium]